MLIGPPVIAVVRRYPPVVYGVLVAGLLVGTLAVVLRQEWLSFVSTGLLLLGVGLFGWTKPRNRVRSTPRSP